RLERFGGSGARRLGGIGLGDALLGHAIGVACLVGGAPGQLGLEIGAVAVAEQGIAHRLVIGEIGEIGWGGGIGCASGFSRLGGVCRLGEIGWAGELGCEFPSAGGGLIDLGGQLRGAGRCLIGAHMGFAQLAADAGALGVGAALGGDGGGTGAGGREALLVLLEGGGQCCQSAGLPFDRDRLLLAAGRERSVVLVVLLQDLLEPGGFGLLGGDGLHRGGRLVLGGLGVLDAQPAGELERLLVLAAGQGEVLAGALVGGIGGALPRLGVDVVGPGLGGFGVSGGTADGAWVPLGETVGQLGGQPGIAAPALLGLVGGGAVGRFPGRGGGGLGGGHVRGQAGGGAGLLE